MAIVYWRSYNIAAGIYSGDAAVWHQNNGARDKAWSNRYTFGSGWGTAEELLYFLGKGVFCPF